MFGVVVSGDVVLLGCFSSDLDLERGNFGSIFSGCLFSFSFNANVSLAKETVHACQVRLGIANQILDIISADIYRIIPIDM